MSVVMDNLRKFSESSGAGAGKDIAGNKQVYEKTLPNRVLSLRAVVLMMAGVVVVLGAGLWVLFHSLKSEIDFQQTIFNTRMSVLDEKLNAADKKIERLISQNESNGNGLEAGMLAIAETQRQLAELSSAVSENKKAQDASIKGVNNKLENIALSVKNAGEAAPHSSGAV